MLGKLAHVFFVFTHINDLRILPCYARSLVITLSTWMLGFESSFLKKPEAEKVT